MEDVIAITDSDAFNNNAQSFWSSEVDGSEVLLGGLLEHLPEKRTFIQINEH